VLEALDGVAKATPSHQKGEVKIELSGEVLVDTLKSTIEAQGYKVN
jgi:copper chaperone CopZ